MSTKEPAEGIIKGKDSFPALGDLRPLIGKLKGELEFGLARKLLTHARETISDNVWIIQQLALCTYKDEELSPATRFAEALELLESIGLRDPSTRDSETLALGGAVYKRLWEHRGQLEHLHEALAFYRAAHERNPEQDMGYGGINAAYILDLLAARVRGIAARTGTSTAYAEELSDRAKQLRERMAADIPKAAEQDPSLRDQYWFVVTLAEIHFGFGNYEKARAWLAEARELDAKEWEKQTTFRQLVSIARLQGLQAPADDVPVSDWAPAWQALAAFLGEEQAPLALSCYRGKVGLALSGGGFRASFYHLGVLARLAEMDVLRSVEVLSTVSGGSIVGAHYYLMVQHLLENTVDGAISRDAYLEIVRELQEQFLAGVERNPRTRALSSFRANLGMIFSRHYTRSHRMGELYETLLFSQVEDGHPEDQPRSLNGLLIRPAGDPDQDRFKPKFSNWRRRAKVPVLLLNATTLNTGHSWQFTARWMGEPPGLIGEEVDVNERLRRPYYADLGEQFKQYPLGHAVAASACVPGLFEPLTVDGLYENRTVRLVDGGVHDNQGVSGLLCEACSLVLCSDATGQMDDQPTPSDSLIGPPLRANSVLMKRVRETQYQDLLNRLDSQSLQGVFFVHLKQALSAPRVDWIGCNDPTPLPTSDGNTTAYGVDRDIQRQLAAVRTDLDSFTETEAYALMLSGYLMTEHQFQELQRRHEKSGLPGTWGDYDIHAPRSDWRFLELETIARQPPDSADPRRQDLGRQLEVAAKRLFKVWHLVPGVRMGSWIAAVVVGLLVVGLISYYWNATLLNLTLGGVVLFIVLAVAVLLVPTLKWLNPERAIRDYPRKALIALLGFVFTTTHLAFFDRLFIKRGRLKRLLELDRTGET